ncbi:OSCP-domain-containing protein [Eremomyces bilateralis CBS 781.70]|uniref:ATP synthase subunit 5, mitochondrial n=1 Tax=Eremomyces bilateralis CBS 781.70 TaxID=1392243 RepID=A0A6G1FTI6_9PEZI|nr:OSCP-domain-containing protein [Eremomyces bilateralis CBS 781.70]KAF1809195.1 OSCP-domain-containing protein [Eremomyces bilateralis CBS 781.70]
MLSRRLFTQAVRSGVPRAPMASVRYYATPASGPSTKPPVALFGIDGTYASALYTAAAKSSSLEPVSKALETLAAVLKKDAKLQNILASPTLTPSDKQALAAELQKQSASADKDNIVKNFLITLAENNRLGVLEPVCEKFGQLMSAYRGEVELVVTSAAPLDQKVLKQLEAAVAKSQYIQQGQRLKVVSKVNPDIRGGLVVEIGDRTIDVSVSAKMARMNKLLKDTL